MGGANGGGDGMARRRRFALLAALGLYCVGVTTVYVVFAWYEIFVVCYGGGVAYLVLSTWQVSWRGPLARADERGGALLRRMFVQAIGLYGAGFVLWNIDNHPHGCAARQALQQSIAAGGTTVGVGGARLVVPPALAFLCELHMWWHFFAGTGTYSFIVWLQVLRGLQTRRAPKVAWGGLGGLMPYAVLAPATAEASEASEASSATAAAVGNDDNAAKKRD